MKLSEGEKRVLLLWSIAIVAFVAIVYLILVFTAAITLDFEAISIGNCVVKGTLRIPIMALQILKG